MLGKLKLPTMFGKHFTVFGGPYVEKPSSMVGVRMAVEIRRPADIVIPTEDFSVPSTHDLNIGLIAAVKNIVAGEPVYVGCMGGRGRTGLFLAVLAKAFGIENPVEYIRENYYSHAVETNQQYQFVENYVVPPVVLKMVRRAKLFSFLRFGKNHTNAVKS